MTMGPPPDVPPVKRFTTVALGPESSSVSALAAKADEVGARAATAATARIIFFTVSPVIVWFGLGDRDRPFAVRAQALGAAGIGCCGYFGSGSCGTSRCLPLGPAGAE